MQCKWEGRAFRGRKKKVGRERKTVFDASGRREKSVAVW
jgi:hypothetical protein